MLFENGIFVPQNIGSEKTTKVLLAATDRSNKTIRPSDLIASAIDIGDSKILAIFTQALKPGANPQDIKDIIEVYNPARIMPTDFDGKRERFSKEALNAIEQFEKELHDAAEGIHQVALELLLSCVFSHLDEEDHEYLTTIDFEQAVHLFRERIKMAIEPPAPVFDSASERLRSEEFTEGGLAVMENAAIQAASIGYDRILPPHCFMAMLGEIEGVAEQIVRLQAKPEIGPGKVAEVVAETFRLTDRKTEPVELNRNGIGEATAELLREAQKMARLWGAEQIDTAHLFLTLLENMPSRLVFSLQSSPLSLDLKKMHEHVEQYLRDSRKQTRREVAFRLPAGILPSEDLTYKARTEDSPKAVHVDGYFDSITRALYRRTNNHVLMTGLKGVGKTALVRELARRAASDEIPFLKRKRFLWVDCQDVSPEESRDKLEAIFTQTAGRTDLIIILDGLGPILHAESGGNNKRILRAALKERRVHLIGIMSDWDYNDLLSADHNVLEFFTRVSVEEPKIEAAQDMVKLAAAQLEKEYRVEIEEKAVNRAVILSADYIMNENLPAKAIKILRRVCEDLDFERTQHREENTLVTFGKVIKVIAEISSVPESTLEGVAEDSGFEKSLMDAVVGQDEAVQAVVSELQLIKSGSNEPGKPASVMFFAGLTGVGKTELAKALAKIYSSSKHLQTYTMGNFTDSHSSSGIIGVPPGYVGHEQGGRLINDMNSDPYSVFLLDEAEKAHPDIWKPFLNLFDEGWIVDQRGVKAFADRSIIILTSNAGHETISRMSQAGKKMEEIIEQVQKDLLTIKNNKTNEPIFSPEFLARIKRIIIFKPLDEKAMEGICRKLVNNMCKSWREKKEKNIVVPENLIKHIAKMSHELNERSGGKEGGRIVSKKISKLIVSSIQCESTQRSGEYKECDRIELLFMDPKVSVTFSREEPLPPAECITNAAENIKLYLEKSQNSSKPMYEVISDSLKQLERGLKSWAGKHPDEPVDEKHEKIIENLRSVCEEVRNISHKAEDNSRSIIDDLVKKIGFVSKEEVSE